MTCGSVAEIVNQEGYTNQKGQPFTGAAIKMIVCSQPDIANDIKFLLYVVSNWRVHPNRWVPCEVCIPV
jgi:hypothetical protein